LNIEESGQQKKVTAKALREEN